MHLSLGASGLRGRLSTVKGTVRKHQEQMSALLKLLHGRLALHLLVVSESLKDFRCLH